MPYLYARGGAQAIDEARIEAKTLKGSDIAQLLSEVDPALSNAIDATTLPATFRALERKLALSGLDLQNIRLAKDQALDAVVETRRRKALKAGSSTRRLERLVQILRNLFVECVDDCGGVKQQGGGPQILARLRSEIKDRLNAEPELFLDATYEELLGIVHTLTGDCRLWWTTEQDLGLTA